jgi:sugar transferase (PEP-CTERM/EpsH1 system associated)
MARDRRRADPRGARALIMGAAAHPKGNGATDARPLIAHVVHRFDVGGLENGVVNLLNRLPPERFRHAVVALTDVTDFRQRVQRHDVAYFALHKPPGHGIKVFPQLYRLFRRLAPAIVHTRNLAALEAAIPAWFARVPVRIHGEHGRDVGDLDGSNRTYRLVRRAHRPFVNHYVTVSADLERYLVDATGVDANDVTRIVNGVDTQRFHPSATPERRLAGYPFDDPALCVMGTVGRLQPVKHQTLLARAFVRALERAPHLRSRLRLVVVGEGPLRPGVDAILGDAGVRDLAWLPGARNDVPDVLRALDVFVLPSLAEGISNTILEAMATGLPVIATQVGGNGELIEHGRTGALVVPDDVDALADAMLLYADPAVARAAGAAGRQRAERLYSLDTMVAAYGGVYERLLAARREAFDRGNARAPARDRATTGSH